MILLPSIAAFHPHHHTNPFRSHLITDETDYQTQCLLDYFPDFCSTFFGNRFAALIFLIHSRPSFIILYLKYILNICFPRTSKKYTKFLMSWAGRPLCCTFFLFYNFYSFLCIVNSLNEYILVLIMRKLKIALMASLKERAPK